MKKRLPNSWKCAILLLFIGVLQLLSLSPAWVEKYYTYGFYPHISGLLRILFGWIPFSMGDLFYFAAGLWFLLKVIKAIRLLFTKKLRGYWSKQLFFKYVNIFLIVYIVFELLWGLNYSRQGIAEQLGLEVKEQPKEDLYKLAQILQKRLCVYGDQVDSLNRLKLDKNSFLFSGAAHCYSDSLKRTFRYLDYHYASIKSSLYTPLGQFIGFTGYYNPFSGEAQLKTDIPIFLRPFTMCHELAHQLGYAKENEANFVGFLAARTSANPEFRYSAYYEMYLYTLRELIYTEPYKAIGLRLTAHPQVKKDYRAYIDYLRRTSNVVEPFMNKFYDQYLKLNNQPHGTRTYDEVVTWLIAYMNKYGDKAI